MSHNNATPTTIKCSACPRPLLEREVTCYQCSSELHFTPCAGVRETIYTNWTKTKKQEWKCTSCRMQLRQIPIIPIIDENKKRLRENGEESDDNNDKNKQHKKSAIVAPEMINDIKEIKTMIMDINKKIENENKELKKEMKLNFEDFNKTIKNLMEQVTQLTKENHEKDKRISTLELRINDIEQQALQNNLEITNIPHKENEDLMGEIQKLTNSMNVQLDTTDITEAYRNYKNNIIIKTSSRTKKKEIMRRIKERKPTNEEGNKIYVNDQLTAHNKKLLWLTKTAAKLNNWKFTWVREGKLYTKQNEESKFIIIKQEEDIKKITI